MSTTSKEEEIKWTEWGKKGTKPPKIKDYAELLMKYNSTAIDLFKETREELREKLQKSATISQPLEEDLGIGLGEIGRQKIKS